MAGHRKATQRRHPAGRIRGWRLATALALALAPAGAARAQDAAAPQLRLDLTPYLWIAGVSGTLRTPLPNAPGQSVDARFGDVLTNLNAIPIMGAAELRYGRFGLAADLLAISVKADLKPVNGPLYSGGDVRVTQVIGSAIGLFRVVESGGHSLDIGLGLRAFGLSTKFGLDAGVLPAVSKSPGASWANPLIGARYHYDITPAWGVTVTGDFGGTSATEQTWQAFGTVDYRLSEGTILRAGYRHMSFTYGSVPLHQTMRMSGPILGATFRF